MIFDCDGQDRVLCVKQRILVILIFFELIGASKEHIIGYVYHAYISRDIAS